MDSVWKEKGGEMEIRVDIYYLTYVNSRRSSSGVAYMFYRTCTRFLQTLSKPELIVYQYYFLKKDDILYIFIFLKEVDMLPNVRTGETILFEGVAVLNMVTSLYIFISNIIYQYEILVIL
jgi:hypothetical protein